MGEKFVVFCVKGIGAKKSKFEQLFEGLKIEQTF
jgi:hypothetical protein